MSETPSETTSEGAREQDAPGHFASRVREATALLRDIRDNRRLMADLGEEDYRELLTLAGQVARPGPYAKRELAREARKRRKQQLRDADERVLAGTGIRAKRRELVYQTPNFTTPPVLPGVASALLDAELAEGAPGNAGEGPRSAGEGQTSLRDARNCYICKEDFSELHFFYDSMCPPCATLNYAKRSQTADLSGRVALITGARVKIGYQAAILLLRAGARVIVSTRFPRDAAARYAAEPDSDSWSDRLEIHGLDLRHTPSVEAFAAHLLATQSRLDFIINNACQTVRRPSGFYQHLMDAEDTPLAQLPAQAQGYLRAYEELRGNDDQGEASALLSSAGLVADAIGLRDSAGLSQLALVGDDLDRSESLYPSGRLDQDLQQVDLRAINSWRLPLAAVSAVELLEVQLVNAVAPFILNARLKELMTRHDTQDKHIVNVSAVEGQFYRSYKTDKHPHTNMAKAALNMMTRTSAVDYVKAGIHMNSVDTGWVSDEDPAAIAARKTDQHGFHPPLDIVDGAARIVDPIFAGYNTGTHQWGLFLKDYTRAPW